MEEREVAERIKKLILRVGDEDLLRLCQTLTSYLTGDGKRDLVDWIVQHMADAVCYLPNKALVYALEVALLSIKQMPIVEQLVDRIFNILQTKLNEGDLLVPKNCLQFFAELMNIGLLNSYVFLQSLFDLSNEAERTFQTTRHYYLQILVKVLPDCVYGLSAKINDEFRNFIESVSNLAKKLDRGCDLYQCWTAVMQAYEEKSIDDSFHKHILNQLSKELQKLKQISKVIKKINFKEKSQKVCFESPTAVPFLSLEGSFATVLRREQIRNSIQTYWLNKELLYEKLYHNNFQFGSGEANDLSFLTHVLMAEGLWGRPQFLMILYSGLLIHLANSGDQEERKVVREAVLTCAGAAYNYLDRSDQHMEALANLLSMYISNFQLEWPWQAWSEGTSPRKSVFMRLLLEKCWLLVPKELFKERVKIPTAFDQFCLVEGEQNPKQFEHILESIKDRKEPADVIVQALKDNEENFKMETFLEALLSVMKNSMDHLTILLQRYEKVFKYFKAEPKFEKHVFEIMFSYFRKSSSYLTIFLQKMIARDIVSLGAFGRWCLDQLEGAKEPQEDYRVLRVWHALCYRAEDKFQEERLKGLAEEIRARRLKLKK